MEPRIYKPSIYKGAGVYKTGAGGGGGGGGAVVPIPEEYTEIDYLQIKPINGYSVKIPFTGFLSSFANTDNRLELNFDIDRFNSANTATEFIRDNNARIQVTALLSAPKSLIFRNGATATQVSNLSGIDLKNYHDIIIDKESFKFGEISGNYPAAYQTYNISKLRIGNSFGTYWSFEGKIYSFKMSKNGGTIFYGVPVKNTSNEEGFFDIVSNNFFKADTTE